MLVLFYLQFHFTCEKFRIFILPQSIGSRLYILRLGLSCGFDSYALLTNQAIMGLEYSKINSSSTIWDELKKEVHWQLVFVLFFAFIVL